MSPDRSISNRIDHIVIDGMHVSSVLDVRTFKGPNVDSDTYLVATKFRLRINASMTAHSSWMLGSCDHKGQLRRSLSLSNVSDIGGQWTNISHSLRTTAETVLGFERPPQRNQWYDEDCREATAAKKVAYKKRCSQPLRDLLSRTIERRAMPFQTPEEGAGKV